MKRRYCAILFDADDTLLDFRAAERAALESVFKRLDLPFDGEAVERYSAINRRLWLSLERGEMTRGELWDRRFRVLFRELDLSANGEEAERLYREALAAQGQTVPGAFSLCRELCERYALYIVTNGSMQTQYPRIAASGLEPFFRRIFVSEEIGFPKPDPRFFDAVFARIPYKREETLLVGDSPTSDIRGGAAAGLDTCWFNPGGLPSPEDVRPTCEIRSLGELAEKLRERGE